MRKEKITINVKDIYGEQAKIACIPDYISKVKELVPEGANVILTGPGPVWLYMKIQHSLHGIVTSLDYDSPASGVVDIFDHNPF